MTGKDWILLVLGGVVGALFTTWYERLLSAVAKSLFSWHRWRRGRDSQLALQAVRFYEKRERGDLLYRPMALGSMSRVPSITHDMHLSPKQMDCFTEDFLVLISQQFTTFRYDRSRIRFLQRAGVRIFDGELLFVESRDLAPNGDLIALNLGRTRYFAYASLSMRLKRELRRSVFRNPRVEDQLLDLSAVHDSGILPQAIGCSCITIFESEDGYVIPISNRSASVANSPGMKATLPSFGLEANVLDRRASRFSLLCYNFIREFAEEMLNVEDLVEMMRSARSDPDWIFHLPEVRDVVTEADTGRLTLNILGVSANPYDGALDLAVLAHFSSPSFYSSMKHRINANWESSREVREVPPIEFRALFDPEIDDWVRGGQFDNCSTVALDLARRFVSHQQLEASSRKSDHP